MIDKYSNNNTSFLALENAFWKTLNVLRKNLLIEDYFIALYLIVVHREKHKILVSKFNESDTKIDLVHIENINVDVNLLRIHQAFRPKLALLSPTVFEEISNLLINEELEMSQSIFSDAFEQILYKLVKMQGKSSYGYLMPFELSRFMLKLADPKVGIKIYNPFAGAASFSILNDNGSLYYGQEINPTIWAIGELRLYVHGNSENTIYEVGDSILNWFPTEHNKMDLIISQPPLNFKLQESLLGLFGQIKTAEQYLIEKSLATLTDDGKLIVCLSNGFLFREGPEKLLRRHLVENNLLESVISFPQGLMMNTEISVSVLVLSKSKNSREIKFVDGSGFTTKVNNREFILNDKNIIAALSHNMPSEFIKHVSIASVLENDCNIIVSRYFVPEIEGSQKLRKYMQVIEGRKAKEGEMGQFISYPDLKVDRFDFIIDNQNIERTVLSRNSTLIEESCLLVYSRNRNLRPSYFNYSGIPVFISSEIIALKVDESKLDIRYLIGELNSGYVRSQLKALSIGDVLPKIKKEDFLNIRIEVLPFEEQKAKIIGVAEILHEQKRNELIAFNKIHGLEKEMYEQNTFLRHSLAGPISNLRNSFANILQIFNEQIRPNIPNVMTLKVSENHLFDLSKQFDFIERDLTKVFNAIKRQTFNGGSFDNKPLIEIDIMDFLRRYVMEISESNTSNYKIELDYDKNTFLEQDTGVDIKPVILGNPDLLTDMFNNLIENAVNHAFFDNYQNRIEVLLLKSESSFLSQSDEPIPVVTILFSNTGTPFPKDFNFNDFIRKGSTAGKNGGDGFGGWYINEIVKFHGGDLNMIDETGPEGITGSDLGTTFEIDIPLFIAHEKV